MPINSWDGIVGGLITGILSIIAILISTRRDTHTRQLLRDAYRAVCDLEKLRDLEMSYAKRIAELENRLGQEEAIKNQMRKMTDIGEFGQPRQIARLKEQLSDSR